MELDNEERVKLKALMSDAFQDFHKLERFLRDECSKHLRDFTDPGLGLVQVLSDVLTSAETDGWVLELLESLSQHRSKALSGTAKRIYSSYLDRQGPLFSQVRIDPLSALFIANEECFIGREELREKLKVLQSEAQAQSVLVVTGSNKCGKSYSYELLKILDRLSTENVVVRIDFKRFRTGALAQRYRDIVSEINTRLDIPYTSVPPHNESETRWFEHAIRKFDTVMRERRKKLWLVFDHIGGQAVLEQSLCEAMTAVARYATEDSQNLRVVLIDLDSSNLTLERGVKKRIEKDKAELPSKEDVQKFLKAAGDAANVRLQPDAVRRAADEIFNSLSGLCSEDFAYEVSEATWKKAAQLNIV